MNPYETLLELKNQRAELLAKGKSLIAEKKFDEHKALMEGEDLKKLNAAIESVEKQIAMESGAGAANPLTPPADPARDAEVDATLDEIRSDKKYAKAFRKALANGVTRKSGVGVEEFAPLYKALSITGGDPAGSNGGFLVPLEFDNAIIRAVKEYVSLAELFNVVNVSTNSGWRAVENGTVTAMPVVSELGTIGKKDAPKFRKIEYAVKKFADRLPVSRELLEDESAELMNYIAAWFAPKYVVTQNSLLLPLLTALSNPVALTAGSEDKILRNALIKRLNTANSRAATLLTNQNGYAAMDAWEDKNGRALLVPDATADNAFRYRGRPVVYGDNTELTADEIYVGNYKALGTLFVRKGIELASTDVGGDSWATDSVEIRAVCRMDAKQVDATAAFRATLPGEPAGE